MTEEKRKRGRPRKIVPETIEVIKEPEPVKEVVKPVDNRINKSLLPIKYNPDIVRNIRSEKEIYPRSTQILINKALLIVDWFVFIMDRDYPEWRKDYTIEEPIVK